MARVTDFTLERYALGELTAEQATDLEQTLATDPELAARMAQIRADNTRFDPASARAFTARVTAQHRAEVRRRWAAGTSLALAALALVAVGASVLRAPTAPLPDEAAEDIRAKGAALRIYRQSGEDVEALRDGELVLPGSTVQLSISVGGVQGAVYSIDGRGAVTQHFPTRGKRSAALPTGPLPTAFTLDTVPDFERFFLVTSDAPFELSPVDAALHGLDGDPDASPDLPRTLQVHATLLRKVNP